MLVAPILLLVLAYNLLKTRKKSGSNTHAENRSNGRASTFRFISLAPTGVGSNPCDVFLSLKGYNNLINEGTVPMFVFKDDNSLLVGEGHGYLMQSHGLCFDTYHL